MKYIDYDEGLKKAKEYCAREEKCRLQVRQKLLDLGTDKENTEQILDQLILEQYINEDRFAREYTTGQFRNNKWGKIKIAHELIRLQIPEECIEHGLEEIDPEDYNLLLRKILTIKLKTLKGSDKQTAIKKMATFAIGKGFEAELVWKMVREFTIDN